MDSTIHVRTKQVVKDQAQEVFLSLGMDTTTAINIFLNQVVREGGLPFTPRLEKRKAKILVK